MQLALYGSCVVLILVLSFWFAWYRPRSTDALVLAAIRGGSILGALALLVLGTLEAGILGFDTSAIIAALIIWFAGFVVGSVLGAATATLTDLFLG
jgi:hypothetical protein